MNKKLDDLMAQLEAQILSDVESNAYQILRKKLSEISHPETGEILKIQDSEEVRKIYGADNIRMEIKVSGSAELIEIMKKKLSVDEQKHISSETRE